MVYYKCATKMIFVRPCENRAQGGCPPQNFFARLAARVLLFTFPLAFGFVQLSENLVSGARKASAKIIFVEHLYKRAPSLSINFTISRVRTRQTKGADSVHGASSRHSGSLSVCESFGYAGLARFSAH